MLPERSRGGYRPGYRRWCRTRSRAPALADRSRRVCPPVRMHVQILHHVTSPRRQRTEQMFEGEYDVVGLMGAVVDNDCQTVFLQQAGEELWIDLGADLDDFSAAGDAAGGEIVVGDHGWTSAGDAAG